MRSLITLLLLPTFIFAQNDNWEIKYEHQKVFIENLGQFSLEEKTGQNTDIEFVFPEQNQSTYFTKSGVVFEFTKKSKVKKTQEEKNERTKRKQKAFTFEEFNAFERVGHRLVFEKDYLYTTWVGSNPNVQIITEDKTDFHYSYTFDDESGNSVSKNNVASYRQITYKNLYPNIDVIYVIHPQTGIKYSAIIHPGGNIDDLKLEYSKKPTLNQDGSITTQSMFGDIVDHAPSTFFENNSKNGIESKYSLNGNIISFEVANYDVTKTIVIDPWTQTPAFATNWDCIWECEQDAAGNVYIIGGVMPMRLIKYDAAGALQWTYNTPYDTTSWLGTFATDDLGNSYVTLGSTAAIQMVNTAGAVVWNNPNPGGLFASTEFWNISFNCDQTKLVIGGTGNTLPPLPYIYDVDMATGNVLASVQVTGGALIPTQEVRSITACDNSRYYWLSHDSIGYIHQNIGTTCPTGSNAFKADNGYGLGYKCEDWRVNNAGIMAIASYGNYIFTHRGNEIHKRDFNTAAIVATAAIPGGQWSTGFGGNNVENSGIAIDDCGNIYVGAKNGVVKFDQNLNQLATYPTSFVVYDVEVSTGGDIIAAGSTGDQNSASRSGSVQSFAASACAPLATTCCDATICQPNAICDTDPAFNLSPSVGGGTFSGTGITNPSAGTFDPFVSGPGTFTIYYTQPCGTDSTIVQVNTCATLTVCIETNGDLTVSGGTGPYTWEEGLSTVGCVAGFANCAGLFSFTDPGPPTLTWSGIGAGSTITPGASDSIQVTDNFGNVFTTFNASGLLPCTTLPCDLVASGVAIDETCDGANDGQIDITITGTDVYDITIGATNHYSGVGAGTYNISGQADGSYTVTITSTTDPTCTEDVIVTINAGPAIADPTISPAGPFCEGDAATNLIAATGGGLWSGTGITDVNLGTFDPTTATAGTWTITYTIAGACGGTDTEDMVVNAIQDATFNYAAGSYCLTDPDPTPTITGIGGGTFSIDNGGTINPTTGEIDIAGSGANSYIVTYVSPGPCPGTETFNVILTSTTDPTISAAGPFCEGDLAVNLVAASGGGLWSGTGITDVNLGTFDPTTATAGTWTITYTIAGSCGGTDTEDIVVNAIQSATFNYAAGSYCLTDPNPTPTITGIGGGTFSIDNGGTINATTGEIDIATSGANNYVVTYISPGPCPGTETFNVTLTTGADATITPVTPVCSSDAAFNFVAVDLGGVWSGTGITDATNGTFDPAVAGPGTYTITYGIIGSCGDTNTTSITVSASDDPTFTYVTGGAYCLSDPDPTAAISGTTGGTFSIDNSGSINASTGQVDLGTSGTGPFVVTYVTAGTCPDSMTFNITISAAFDATVSAPGPFCSNDAPSNLSAVDPGGTWSGTGITDPVNGTFDPATSGAGTFNIMYGIAGSCGDTSTISIVVNAADDAAFTYASSTFCSTDPNPLPIITGTIGGVFTISGGASINAGTGEVNLGASGTGSYTVTYTTTGVCPDVQTFAITVTTCSSPTVTVSASDNLICEGDCITFTEISTGSPTTWQWTFPGGTPASSTNQNPGTICFDTPGIHVIEVIATNAFGADTSTIVVTVNATPTVSAGPDQNIIIGETAVLTAIGSVGTYTWFDPATLSCATCISTNATPPVTTGYLVTLVDSAGCIATDSVTVHVTYVEEVGVPNAFSPNGDGVNDILYVDGAGFASIEFKIYNRYGQLVFQTTDQSIGWDGTFNGKRLNPGTFAYFLDYTFQGSDGGVQSGNITLIK